VSQYPFVLRLGEQNLVCLAGRFQKKEKGWLVNLTI